MADSAIVVSDLKATPGIGHIALRWAYADPHAGGGLPYLQLDAVELHAAATNDRAAATKVDEGVNNALHVALVEGATYYYWIRARDRSGLYGEWHPASATAGVQGTVGFSASAVHALINGKFSVEVAANAVTCAIKTLSGDNPSVLNPVVVMFRSATASDASPVFRQITSQLSLTIPAGATMGFEANDPGRIWWSLFDVGDGAVALAGRNCSTAGGIVFPLPEFGLADTVLNDTGADSAGVFYGDSALASRPFRIVGFSDWSSGLATPGLWSSNPDRSQMFGPGIPKPGDVVQTKLNFDSQFASGSTQIPLDDTIPQITEGDEYFSTSIAPSAAVNLLHHETIINWSHSGNVTCVFAMFKDSDADAVASAWSNSNTNNSGEQIRFLYFERARGVVETTYTIRCGPFNGVATMYVNGSAGARLLGGSLISGHKISEIMG